MKSVRILVCAARQLFKQAILQAFKQYLPLVLLMPFALLAPVANAVAADKTQFEISTLAPMPIAVQEIYPVLHQGDIYVAGGISSALPLTQGQMTDALQIYNPAQNSWRLGPKLPEPRHHAMLVSTSDALWILGGFVKDPQSLLAAAATNAKNDFWQQGNWMASADILKLPNGSNSWQKVAKLPAPLAETVSFVLDGHIHLVSGRSPEGKDNSEWGHHTDTGVHYVFNPATLKTDVLPALHTPKNSAAVAMIHQQAYWLGGRHRSLGNLASSARFDSKTNNWQAIAKMPQAQAGLAAAAIGSGIYAFGGEGANNKTGVFAEIWRYDSITRLWQSAGKMQPARHGHGAVAINEELYVVGGATTQGLAQTTALTQRYRLRPQAKNTRAQEAE